MKPREMLLAWCAIVGLLAGCAADGGVGGTGIATVRGNVLDPEVAVAVRQPAAGLGASAAGITVRVRNTSVSDETDALGFFELSGEIAGEITIDFVRDNHPVATAEGVIVPVDAEVTLKDIALLDSVATPEEIAVDNMIATMIAAPICHSDGSGALVVRDDGGLTIMVDVTATTVITDTRGELTCAELNEDSQVKLRGVQENQEITASDVRVLKHGRATSL